MYRSIDNIKSRFDSLINKSKSGFSIMGEDMPSEEKEHIHIDKPSISLNMNKYTLQGDINVKIN